MHCIVTCEHAGNIIPNEFESQFEDYQEELMSHRGYDIGAKQIAIEISKLYNLPFFWQDISRLLIENNRSINHPNLFSSVSKKFSDQQKKFITNQYYWPYRNKVETFIADLIEAHNMVLHLSIHSFTPELNGEIRNTEIGLLYDPARILEKSIARDWKTNLLQLMDWRVRFNYPYLGKADGFTTYLRRRFGLSYIGIELEVNQYLCQKDQIDKASKIISKSLDFVMHAY